jgi:Cu-Zn family superoxide dismutase
MKCLVVSATLVLLGSPVLAVAGSVTVEVHKIDDSAVGESVGTVRFKDTRKGVSIIPALKGLDPGEHGFHVHENGDCGPKEKDGKMTAGVAAGGHLDPEHTGAHQGPEGHGHLGDLPILVVDAKGKATHKLLAPRLKVSDLKGHSLMIHASGDSFSDTPKPLGGSGARVACGVIP